MLKCLVFGLSFVLLISLIFFSPAAGFSEESKKDEVNPLALVIEKTMGRGVKIIRIDKPENSPVPNWKQTRVWMESVYGETPVLFYSSEDGKLIFAGSIFSASGENLTRKDVGETKPKSVENAKMELNEDYRIGNKDSLVKAVLWIGADPYSKELFEAFYDLYNKNKDKVALYLKFYPRSEADVEKMKALTCFKGESLANALKTLFAAVPGWGNKEELDVFKATGDLSAYNEELVIKDLKLAADLKLPVRPVAFINNIMVIEKITSENIKKLSGVDLN